MPIGLLNSQWLAQNETRSYPIVDWASKEDTTGTIVLPNSFLLYMHLPVHAGLDVQPEKFYLKSLLISPTGYTLTVGYDDGSSSPPSVAVTSIARSSHREFRSYALVGIDDFDDSVGFVVVGRLADVDALSAGFYSFAPAASALEVDVIRPNIRGLTSITVVNGADRSDRLYGDIELVARDNMRIAVSTVEGEPPRITFSAIRGEGLNDECACADEDTSTPVRFINGIPPGPDSNFKLVGDNCITISPIVNGLKLTDACSQPCCGCTELNAVLSQLDRFADGEATLRAYVNNLVAATAQLSSVILSSRVGNLCVEG